MVSLGLGEWAGEQCSDWETEAGGSARPTLLTGNSQKAGRNLQTGNFPSENTKSTSEELKNFRSTTIKTLLFLNLVITILSPHHIRLFDSW